MTKQIEIVIAPDGKSTVTTKGYTGSSCQDASKFLEKALGQVEADKKTADYFADSNSQQQQEAGQ